MNVTDLKEDQTHKNHWTATVNGVVVTVVTREGQDPQEVIEEMLVDPVETYRDKRVQAYPSIQDQLDMLYHDPESWRVLIGEIKDRYPKA